MSKHPQPAAREQRAPDPQPARRVRVIALVEDTTEGQPRSWAVALGTVPADALAVEKLVPQNNAQMAKAHAFNLIDGLELLG